MAQYDYKVLEFDHNTDAFGWYENGAKVCAIHDLCDYLNQLGSDRWKLVKYNSAGDGIMILRRKR